MMLIRWCLPLALLAPLFDLYLAMTRMAGTEGYRHGFTEVMRWGTWPAAVLVGVLLLLALLRCQRVWTDIDRGLLASVFLFFLGCLVGATIRGDSTSVPAHYHGTVGAVSLAYMLWLRYEMRASSLPQGAWWRRQPFAYAVGISLLVLGLAWSGWLGVPRKMPHVDLVGSDLTYFVAMGLAGAGGMLATLGAGAFVAGVGLAVWRNRRV